MDLFQAILAQVRTLLSSRQPRRVRALLDSLRQEELLSGEYHRALLLEPDREALARKISLTLLGGAARGSALPGGPWNRLPAPAAERGPGCRDQGGSGHCATVDPGPLEGGYLELLNSSADPLHLYHFYDQMDLAAEEEAEPCSEPDADTINCDQFSRLLCDVEGDEETREAYANIAALDQYVFQDSQLEGLSRDLFMEHIGLDGVLGEGLEVPAEPGPRSQKRPLSEEHPADLKHRKLAEAPAVPIVTGSFLVGPVSDPVTPPGLPAALYNQEPVSSQIHLEKAVQMPEPPPTASVSCLHLPAGPIQVISTLPTLPQGLWPVSGAGTGLCSIFICHGETPLTSQAPPSTGPAVHSLPKSPDRPGSTSPFAPSAADLPSMPEPALTARPDGTGKDPWAREHPRGC